MLSTLDESSDVVVGQGAFAQPSLQLLTSRCAMVASLPVGGTKTHNLEHQRCSEEKFGEDKTSSCEYILKISPSVVLHIYRTDNYVAINFTDEMNNKINTPSGLHRPKRKMRQNAVMTYIFYNYVSGNFVNVLF